MAEVYTIDKSNNRQSYTFAGNSLTIGRSSDNNVIIEDSWISGNHLVLHRDQGMFFYT